MKKAALAIVPLLFLIGLPFLLGSGKGVVKIQVRNNSPAPVRQLEFKYRGGCGKCGGLAPGQVQYLAIRVKGETSLWVEYVRAGKKQVKDMETYLSNSLSGAINIWFDKAGNLHWKSDIRVWPAWLRQVS